MISVIAAIGKNNEIGKDNKLIWNIPRDMKFFKETTMGNTVVMGMNTYKSLPNCTLPGRKMIVITDKPQQDNDKVTFVYSVEEILNKYKDSFDNIFVIGGASIYNSFIEYSDCMYLTLINAECLDADCYFPSFDDNDWNISEILSDIYENIEFKICKYERKRTK